jgi:hypothetical protein
MALMTKNPFLSRLPYGSGLNEMRCATGELGGVP